MKMILYRTSPRAILKFPLFPALNIPLNLTQKLRCSGVAKQTRLVISDSMNREVAREFPFFQVFKDGSVEKFRWPPEIVPPSDDPVTGIRSTDITISDEPAISARIFLPRAPEPETKLPVLFYVHGGGFCFESAFSSLNDRYVRIVANEANAVAVSVEYRLAPEHPIPACYEDSWAALQWLASHANGSGQEPWLNCHADLRRVFLAGDSAGGNICHTLASRVGSDGIPGMKVVGAVLSHPYFGGTQDDAMWLHMCPTNGGLQDPRLKPTLEDLAMIGCDRMLILVAGKDHLNGVGKDYFEALMESGWKGTAEIIETEDEDHCFHIDHPTCEKAAALIKKIGSFINQS